MSDLVKRIRDRANDAPMPSEHLLDEAADRIDALEAALRECYWKLSHAWKQLDFDEDIGLARDKAEAVLEGNAETPLGPANPIEPG